MFLLYHFARALSSADFIFPKKVFKEYHQSIKLFGFRSVLSFVGSDLGLPCLQRISEDDTRIEIILNKHICNFQKDLVERKPVFAACEQQRL